MMIWTMMYATRTARISPISEEMLVAKSRAIPALRLAEPKGKRAAGTLRWSAEEVSKDQRYPHRKNNCEDAHGPEQIPQSSDRVW